MRAHQTVRHVSPLLQRSSALLAALALFAAGDAGAAPAMDGAAARAQKEACLHRQSHQDQATCIKEATAVLNESRSNRTENETNNYNQNALLRCNALPDDERSACQRRINGEGSTSGSVEGGGMLREVVTPDQQQ